MIRALLAAATLVAGLAGCLHEPTSTPLRGEIERRGAMFLVKECSTDRVYELRLVPAAHVALERRVDEIARQSPGPVLVELGGKALPATPDTPADAIFDVYERYAVRAGACR